MKVPSTRSLLRSGRELRYCSLAWCIQNRNDCGLPIEGRVVAVDAVVRIVRAGVRFVEHERVGPRQEIERPAAIVSLGVFRSDEVDDALLRELPGDFARVVPVSVGI